jgi:hypothetical protein
MPAFVCSLCLSSSLLLVANIPFQTKFNFVILLGGQSVSPVHSCRAWAVPPPPQYRSGTGSSSGFLCRPCRSSKDYKEHRVGRGLSFFSSRRNLDFGLSQPLTRRRVGPPFGSGGKGHTRWRERGWESGSQFLRGDIHCGTLYMYVCTVLCGKEIPIYSRSSIF